MCVHRTVHNCCTQYCTEQTWQFSPLPSRRSPQLQWCLFEGRGDFIQDIHAFRFKRRAYVYLWKAGHPTLGLGPSVGWLIKLCSPPAFSVYFWDTGPEEVSAAETTFISLHVTDSVTEVSGIQAEFLKKCSRIFQEKWRNQKQSDISGTGAQSCAFYVLLILLTSAPPKILKLFERLWRCCVGIVELLGT